LVNAVLAVASVYWTLQATDHSAGIRLTRTWHESNQSHDWATFMDTM